MSEQLEPTGLFQPAKVAHPWDVWLNGQVHVLVWGEDFQPNASTFRLYIYRMARKRGVKVVIGWDFVTDRLCIQAYPPKTKRPLLPEPFSRLGNGQVPGDGPHRPQRDVPEGTPRCSRCNTPLLPINYEIGRCNIPTRPEWRCTP